MMRAIGIYQGEPIATQQFETVMRPVPKPTGNDVLVRIRAVSVNPVDTKVRQVTHQNQLKVLGYDAVGVVEVCGDHVTSFKAGDRVYYAGSNQRDGADQEYQLVDADLIALAPTQLSDEDAAAMPLTMLTAYELLFEKGHQPFEQNANRGKTVLVINGAGGVGSSAIQLAKWAGFRVIATAHRPETIEWVQRMGADQVVDHHQDLLAQLAGLEDQIDVIMILHTTESYFEAAAHLVKPLGHVGSIVESQRPLPLGMLKDKAASFDWEFMFAKAKYGIDAASQGQILTKLAQLLDAGVIHTTRTQTIEGISATTLHEAHAIVERGQMVGKLVLTAPFA